MASPIGCMPLLFRRKSFGFEGKEVPKANKKYDILKNLPRLNRNWAGKSKIPKSVKGSKVPNPGTGAGKFLKMEELRKKTLIFRDLIDLPPCSGSTSANELVITTLKDLHTLYPDIVPANSMSEMTGTPIDQALASLCDALKAIGDMWMGKDEWAETSSCITYDNMAADGLERQAQGMLDGMIKVARERLFDLMDHDDHEQPSKGHKFRRAFSASSSSCSSDKSLSSSPETPTSVLQYGYGSPYSPQLLLPLRVEAVGKLNPIDVKRLSVHMFPYMASPERISTINNVEEVEEEENESKSTAMESGATAIEDSNEKRRNSTVFNLNLEPIIVSPPMTPKVVESTLPPQPMSQDNVASPPPPPPPQAPELPHSTHPPPPPKLAPSSAAATAAAPPPPKLAPNSTAAAQPPPSKLAVNSAAAPPSPPSMTSGHSKTPLSPPPPKPSRNCLTPSPPTRKSMSLQPQPSPPQPMISSNGATPPPPPPRKSISLPSQPPSPQPKISRNGPTAPPPPPPESPTNRVGGPPPPPPFGSPRSLRPKKATTKLKRSSHMGNLYRLLKGKVEGSNLDNTSLQPKRNKVGASSAGGKQGMADALAEMTKRSAYFQQIEEDVKNHAKIINELKVAISTFQTTDMAELVKFHKYVESHLEKLTDESQVLARFEGFPGKKLEALRMAAVLYTKLDGIATNLQNWNTEAPVGQLLDKAESYFNKIKGDLDAVERTKDEESKKLQSQKIHFDFGILTRIKELMVDVSSSCMELALEDKRQAMKNEKGQNGSKTEEQRKGCAKMLWRAFQFAFRVYTFAGGQDERADRLTREVAREIECA